MAPKQRISRVNEHHVLPKVNKEYNVLRKNSEPTKIKKQKKVQKQKQIHSTETFDDSYTPTYTRPFESRMPTQREIDIYYIEDFNLNSGYYKRSHNNMETINQLPDLE